MRKLNVDRTRKEVARCVLATLMLAAMPWVAAAEDAAPGSKVSGSLNFDFNTHFMSYGFNVWQTKDFDDILLNPSFDIAIELPAGFSIYGGTWWDVNNNAATNVGDYIQEIDVWGGVGYSAGIVSVSATYQEWYYGGDVERIVDLGLGLDVPLSPSLTIHGRVDGNGAQDEGIVGVLGVSHSFDLGALSLTPHADVAVLTDDFYVKNKGGFGYVSGGVGASVPLTMIPSGYGDWSINADLTYYYTDHENVANRDDDILTGMMGLSLAF